MEKACIFYASKYHLSMILSKILGDENVKKYTVTTFLENPIKNEIEDLTLKYKLKINSKNKIDFKETKDIKNKKIDLSEKMIFIVEGNKEYIYKVNNYITKIIKNKKLKKIRIINCYNINNKNTLSKEILEENKKIIFTTGEKYLTISI